MTKDNEKMKNKEKDINKQQKEQQEKASNQEAQKTEAKQQEENSQTEETQTEQTREGEEKQKKSAEKEQKTDKKKASKGKKEKEEKSEKEKKKEEKTDAEKLKELQDKYLRLTAEYDNYRKRTLKEKMELSKSAGEDVLQSLLPVMDDFERALQSIDESQDIDAVKEGVHLIYNKFKESLEQKGVKEIEAKDQEFDTDKHEAVSKIPAPSEDLKGKVVDVIQKGYYLNDKILRYSKVVIGE